MLMPYLFQEDVEILKMNGDRVAVVNMFCGNQPVFICQKAVSNINARNKLCVYKPQKSVTM